MTIEQKIFSKLEPHAKRINDGEGDDFDYLPAVLLHLMEEQKRQAKLLDDTAKLLASVKNEADTIGVQNKGAQIELQNSQSSMCEQIAVFANAHAAHTTQTNKVLSAIGLQIESLGSSSQRSHTSFNRLLIVGLLASTVMIGLAVVILLRH